MFSCCYELLCYESVSCNITLPVVSYEVNTGAKCSEGYIRLQSLLALSLALYRHLLLFVSLNLGNT